MKSCKECTLTIFPTDAFLNLDGCHYHARCARCKDCACKITLQNFTAPSADGAILLCKVHYTQLFRQGGAYAGDEKFAKSSSTINRTMTSTRCAQQAKTLAPKVQQVEKPQKEEHERVLAAQGDEEEQHALTPPSCEELTTSGLKDVLSNFPGMLALNVGCDEADATDTPVRVEAAASKLLPSGEKEGLKRGSCDGGAVTGSGSTESRDGRKENVCHVCEKTVYAADPQLTLGRFKFHKACAKCDDCKTKITLSNCTAPSLDGNLLCSVHFKARFQQEGRYRGGEQFKHKA
jgi:hypothetical protein